MFLFVFGLEVSNKDKMLLDFGFGRFCAFAVNTKRGSIMCVFCSLLLDLRSQMFELGFTKWMHIAGILVCYRIGDSRTSLVQLPRCFCIRTA